MRVGSRALQTRSMARVFRLQCLAVVLLLAVAAPAGAGMRACRIALVNLDEDTKSTRFPSLHRALSELSKPRAQDNDGIVGAIELPRALLKGALKPGCALTLPATSPIWEEQQADFITLYCANGDASSITIAMYQRYEPNARLTLTLAPRSGAVGQSCSRIWRRRCCTSPTRSSHPDAAIPSSSVTISEASFNRAAARFSRRCASDDVPGISRMLGRAAAARRAPPASASRRAARRRPTASTTAAA